ncbi:MAG: glycosyl transferase, partial [Clostridium perfringens]
MFSFFEKNKELQIELGCKEDKIQIIPNGVKLERFSSINRKKDNDSIINIGAIVRVVPIKDVKTIIQAFILANETIKNIKLYIMGHMDEDEDYTREC